MEFFELGKIIKLHGYKGELVVWLKLDDPRLIEALDFVFINNGVSTIPHEIIKSSHKKDQIFRIKLKEIDSEREAKKLIGKVVFIPQSLAEKFAYTSITLDMLPSFKVFDEVYGELGVVEKISHASQNPLIVIQKDYKEILIPFNKEIVVDVIRDKKEIHVHCPEGLLDLYM